MTEHYYRATKMFQPSLSCLLAPLCSRDSSHVSLKTRQIQFVDFHQCGEHFYLSLFLTLASLKKHVYGFGGQLTIGNVECLISDIILIIAQPNTVRYTVYYNTTLVSTFEGNVILVQ